MTASGPSLGPSLCSLAWLPWPSQSCPAPSSLALCLLAPSAGPRLPRVQASVSSPPLRLQPMSPTQQRWPGDCKLESPPRRSLFILLPGHFPWALWLLPEITNLLVDVLVFWSPKLEGKPPENGSHTSASQGPAWSLSHSRCSINIS